MESLSHPNRVFIVTGIVTLLTTALVISAISSGDFISAEPALLLTTFFTQQP